MIGGVLWLSLLCGVILGISAISVFLSYRAHHLVGRIDTRPLPASSTTEMDLEPIRKTLDSLAAQLRDLQSNPQVPTPAGAPRNGFNLSKRSQALRMHRRGESADQIAAALEMPKQEVELLLKVHAIVIQNV